MEGESPWLLSCLAATLVFPAGFRYTFVEEPSVSKLMQLCLYISPGVKAFSLYVLAPLFLIGWKGVRDEVHQPFQVAGVL